MVTVRSEELISLAKVFAGKTVLQLLTEEKRNGLIKVESGNENQLLVTFLFQEIEKPVIFLLPGAGATEKNRKLLKEKFSFLLQEGYGLALCHFCLPFPRTDTEFFFQIKQEVAVLLAGMDFWQKFTQRENPDFYLVAVSAGGFPAIISSCLDKRVKKILLLVSGGDCENLTWKGLLRFALQKDCPRKACRQMHRTYHFILRNSLYSQISLLPRYCFLYDPLTLAPAIAERKIMMINGLFDLVVPFTSALKLRKRLKNPPCFWYPGTHLMLPWFLPFFRRKIKLFFKEETANTERKNERN